MLSGKIYGRYSLVYLHVWQFHEDNDEPVAYKPKNRKRLVNGIVYIREGNATVHELDNNRIFTVHPGELMLIPMDVAYTITWEAGTRTHDLADFLFNYDCCIQYHSERGVTTCDTINMSRRDVLPSFLPSGKITVIPADSHSDSLETIWKELHEAYNSIISPSQSIPAFTGCSIIFTVRSIRPGISLPETRSTAPGCISRLTAPNRSP